MKKVLSMGLMAIFVTTTVGCQDNSVDVLSATSIDQCVASGADFLTCSNNWEQAKAMHQDVAPKFDDANSCLTSFGESCEKKTVTNSDGSTSSIWMPMMAGMMMGHMMSSSTTSNPTQTRPLYAANASRDKKTGVMTGALVTPSGNNVSGGVSRMSPSAASSVPKSASVASTRATVSSRGGFGSAARGASAAS